MLRLGRQLGATGLRVVGQVVAFLANGFLEGGGLVDRPLDVRSVLLRIDDLLANRSERVRHGLSGRDDAVVERFGGGAVILRATSRQARSHQNDDHEGRDVGLDRVHVAPP